MSVVNNRPGDVPVRIGIDTGGTFTDFVYVDARGRWSRWKTLSTPKDPSRAILKGLAHIFPGGIPENLELIHGTTVGTNAFLERKGARTVLITTRGFEDILWIGRQARPSLYDFLVERPRPVISKSRITGVNERMAWTGEVITGLSEEEIRRAVDFAQAAKAKSIAVCLLHSYANPLHENQLAKALENSGVHVSISSRIMPAFREYERLSTTLVNAYIGPVVEDYLGRLEKKLPGAHILVQQSHGGCRPSSGIRDQAVQTLLSGPAGGVQGAWELAGELGFANIITLDMGGTSTDVSLCAGGLTFTRDYRIEGYPVAVPVIDIHTVGAGGGSVAWIDKGGLLKTGPRSAGADPGPVCYGKGREITVTDANVFLGRLRPEAFLGGGMPLEVHRIDGPLAELSHRLGLSPQETARGVIRLVNTNMVQAIRSVSIERGYDPRRFVLVCFGGAAGLHAAELADELEMPAVLFPELGGVFSAFGMMQTDLVFEKSRALLLKNAARRTGEIESAIEELRRNLLHETAFLRTAGKGQITWQAYLDCRYHGQSHELQVPFSTRWPSGFVNEHKRLYGHELPGRDVEVTALRVRAALFRGTVSGFLREKATGDRDRPVFQRVSADFGSGMEDVPLYTRSTFPGDRVVCGPALIVDDYTTIMVPRNWGIRNYRGHLLMEKSDEC